MPETDTQCLLVSRLHKVISTGMYVYCFLTFVYSYNMIVPTEVAMADADFLLLLSFPLY